MKKFLQKKNVLSRTIVTLLTMAMLSGSITTTALAAEPIVPDVAVSEISVPEVAVSEVASQANNENEGIMPLSSGYAAGYTNTNTGSFTISVTGSSLSSSVRLKAWSFSSAAKVYVSLYRPNGKSAFTDQLLTLEELQTKTVYNVSAGDWTLHYYIIGNGRGWINCEFR